MSAGAVFTSRFAVDFQDFLAFKHTLGYPYRRAEFTLCAFDRFLIAHPQPRQRQHLAQFMLQWLERTPGRKPVTVACELAVLRQFYAFLQRRGRRLAEPLWPAVPAVSEYVPYVFSKDEVRQLVRLTRTLGRPPFRRVLYRTLLLVLYCTGLRFGEAVGLRLRDVDVGRRTIFVRHSKGRARWVPCHQSLCRELRRYLVARQKYAPTRRADDCFFLGGNQEGLKVATASATVCRLLRRAGFKPERGRVGPRPYDLRHAFAVHRLTAWYRAGVDLHARLPWLSAYMGHDDLLGTETYLTATPELLAVASDRFHRRYRDTHGSQS